MNCFYHTTTAAIGLCKSCSKGLCPACAADVGKGLACRGRCESEVVAVNQLVERSLRMSARNEQIVMSARSNRFIGASFYLVLGFLFVGFGTYRFLTEGLGEPVFFFGLMGGSFIVFGVISLAKAITLP